MCDPILFVITSGAEPTQELRALAEKRSAEISLTEISIGPDSVDASIQCVQEAAAAGCIVPPLVQKPRSFPRSMDSDQECSLVYKVSGTVGQGV